MKPNGIKIIKIIHEVINIYDGKMYMREQFMDKQPWWHILDSKNPDCWIGLKDQEIIDSLESLFQNHREVMVNEKFSKNEVSP